MKQKLFLLFVGFVLTAIPASGGTVTPVGEPSTGAFGTATGDTLTTMTTGGGFQMSVTVEVFKDDTTGVFTYVYSIRHNSTSNLVLTTVADKLFEQSLAVGWVGGLISPFATDPEFLPDDPFTTSINETDWLRFQFSIPANMDANGDPLLGVAGDPLIAYAQSYLGPVDMIVYIGDDASFGVNPSAAGLTLGPGDAGTGSGVPTPEPGSLILLTFGLLSGGYLRFKKRKQN